MNFVLAVFGLFLIVFTIVDVLQTTLMSRGSGSFSDRLTSVLWRAVMARRQTARSDEDDDVGGGAQALSQAGIVIMMAVIITWIVLVWLGWALFFGGYEYAIVNAQTQAPAGFWERVYFAGYTLFTLGLGDFRPVGHFWQVLVSLAALNGLFVVTFSITYMVPVLQAATHRRSLAVYLSGLGRSPEEIILTAWDGRDCSALEAHLSGLALEVATLAQRHLTYPVLHYFHGTDRREALAPSLAALDEALTVFECAFEEDCAALGARRPVRTAISEFLENINDRFIDAHEDDPPRPSLDAFRRAGLPVCSDEAFAEALEPHKRRRRLLFSLVEREGWSWEAVSEAEYAHLDHAAQSSLAESALG